jgi:hypothetical protein
MLGRKFCGRSTITALFGTFILGVEDGQTVRMPVGKKEIFITFRVGVCCTDCVVLTVLEWLRLLIGTRQGLHSIRVAVSREEGPLWCRC